MDLLQDHPNQAVIVAHLARLKACVVVFNDEIALLERLLHNSTHDESKVEVVDGVPFPKSSMSVLDVQAILARQTPDSKETPALPASGAAPAAYDGPLLFGEQSVFVKHFDAEFITGGQGTLGVGKLLKQYEEDLLQVSFERLMFYPSGFYRNRINGERQFLLKNNERTLFARYIGMPDPNGMLTVTELKEGGKLSTVILPHDYLHSAEAGLRERACAIAQTIEASFTLLEKAQAGLG